jgi:hypothetical protein
MAIPIPERMKHLKVDPRGYAIPYGVVIDRDGVVHFSINDEVTRRRSIKRDLCSICGKTLLRGRWFVGGSLSAFHPAGAFIDPPMHYECSHYALQVCPYLSAPHYAREIGLHKAEAKREALDDNLVLVDPTMIPGRPRDDTFVAICTTGQDIFDNGNTKPKHPYLTIEFWKHGRLIERLTGAALKLRCIAEADRALAEMPLEQDA